MTLTKVQVTAVINGDTVEISIPDNFVPSAVRYAYSKVPENPNLYNNENLPAAPFTADLDTVQRFSNPISLEEQADPAIFYNDGYYYATAAASGNRSVKIYKSDNFIDI